jgi:adenine-specific DNA-methyltransferase
MNSLEYVYGRGDHSAYRTSEYVFHQLIPYIGNKRKLLGLIHQAVAKTEVSPGAAFLDLFAGSGVVSRMAKKQGFRVLSNDWEPYAREINQCYIQCNSAPGFQHFGGYDNAVAKLNAVAPREDWITKHLCPADDAYYDIHKERLFYTHSNGMIIDAMRIQLQCWQADGLLSELEMSCLLAPMLYQACYTSNTSGVFKGFHNGWGGQTKTALYRILSQFQLKPAIFHDNGQENSVYKMDAVQLAQKLRGNGETIDIAYLDPPYNQHPYGSNYHVLNTITLWDKPPLTAQIEGRNKSAIREDWRTERRSPYNHRSAATDAYDTLLQSLDARYILTSYSTDGTIPLSALVEACLRRGHTDFVTQQYKRYRVSAQRFSSKPLNVELILIVDTQKKHTGLSADAICESILHTEQSALNRHQETGL